jgi:hypothetical protein
MGKKQSTVTTDVFLRRIAILNVKCYGNVPIGI